MLTHCLYGPPGVGKGTQAKTLSSVCGAVRLDMGDYFRHIKDPSFHEQWGEKMAKGDLLPDEDTIEHFDEMYDGARIGHYDALVLDGFPRSEAQALHLVNKFRKNERYEGLFFVEFVAEKDVCIERLRRRAQISGRLDDKKEDAIQNRWFLYQKRQREMEHFFKLLPRMKYVQVDASGSETLVWENLTKALRLGNAVQVGGGS